MCGITGIISLESAESISEDTIRSMCDTIEHRGPNDQGVLTGDGFGVGSRRLSIIDLSTEGHMPMSTADNRYHIAYNGEVYNFAEIREKLEKLNISFRSHTDTEVVLKSYIEYGPECMNDFNGMFGFVIQDTERKTTFIARDRLGIKPLHYTIHEGKLIFGSELKTLWAAGVPKVFNDEKFEELLSFRYVAGEETIYKNVKRLLPGHYMMVENGKINIKKWWSLSDAAERNRKPENFDVVSWYKNTFDDSIRLRKISDVPVGILLSGGLDSGSAAAALGRTATGRVSSFTVRFKEKGYDEGDLAELVAKKYNLDYNELFLDPATLFEKTKEALRYNDEPIFHASDLFVMEIAKYAKKKVTVLLSGEGGDETLGGYVRYQPLRKSGMLKFAFAFGGLLKLLPVNKPRVRKLIRMLSLGSIDNFILYNMSEVLPMDIEQLDLKKRGDLSYRKAVLSEAKKVYPHDPFRQVMFYDMHIFLCSLLDRNDLMTMGASIECRVPFLDYRIVEGLAGLPTKLLLRSSETKSLLREALGDRLPPELLSAKKWGFGIPWAQYYRNNPDFKNYISKMGSHPVICGNFKDPAKVAARVESFLNGDNSGFPLVNQLFNICLWYDVNFES
jgi:asparagine synthase (glutamine-hydrolysing)